MGRSYGRSYEAIQEYFRQKYCRFCDHPFTSEGIELLREEPGVLVVRVSCSSCGRPLGIAIVGTQTSPATQEIRYHPPDWTKRDRERLANQPAITYDDVLTAHQFLTSIGPDWAKHIPKLGRPRSA